MLVDIKPAAPASEALSEAAEPDMEYDNVNYKEKYFALLEKYTALLEERNK